MGLYDDNNTQYGRRSTVNTLAFPSG